MKQIFFSFALAISGLVSTDAKAQFPYQLTVQSGQPYNKLSGATSLTNNVLWDSDDHFAAPIGFNSNIAGTVNDTLYLLAGNFATPQIGAVMDGFAVLATSLMDRGSISGTARSDIRYETVGSQGFRIFKLEVFNAGFETEFLNNGELKDSVSFQIWVYESNHAVEFRFGPSMVSNFQDYFGSNIFSGFVRNIDTAQGTFDNYYVLNGNPTAPTIDSLSSILDNKGLTSMPASGIVYRFTPKGTTGIKQLTPGTLASVYPTVCSQYVTVKASGNENIQAVIFNNFGQCVLKSKILSGTNNLDLSGMAPGSYFVRLTDSAGGFETHHIVKH